MRIRLTRWLAAFMDGIDMSGRSVGDVVDLCRHDAELLIAEGWAMPVGSRRRSPHRRAGRTRDLDGRSMPRKDRA
jgi:hypothetical protein